MKKYYVIVSSAKMPASVKAPYRRIAVIKGEDGRQPMRIENTSKQKIIEKWDACHLGYRPKGNTAAQRAERDADAMARELNSRD